MLLLECLQGEVDRRQLGRRGRRRRGCSRVVSSERDREARESGSGGWLPARAPSACFHSNPSSSEHLVMRVREWGESEGEGGMARVGMARVGEQK